MQPMFFTVLMIQKIREQKPSLNLTPTMKMLKSSSISLKIGILTAWLVAAAPWVRAATIWDGPTVTFTHSTATGNLQDQLTPGVKITRGSSSGGLFNSVTESSAAFGVSPKNTEWAVGSLANFNTLTYGPCPLEAGGHPPRVLPHRLSDQFAGSLTCRHKNSANGRG